MHDLKHADEVESALSTGFGTVDEKGRISLSKPLRQALGVQAGSSLAYVLLDGALLLIPQDEHLAALLEGATRALSARGITARDFLDDLPAARAEVMGEAYRGEFLRELERLRGTDAGGGAADASATPTTPAE